jgi:hypothetical protein
MPKQQVLRFAVGAADGPRTRTGDCGCPRGKSDLYISGRRVANSVKVSIHEPGPARFALTSEFVREHDFTPPDTRTSAWRSNGTGPGPRPVASRGRGRSPSHGTRSLNGRTPTLATLPGRRGRPRATW